MLIKIRNVYLLRHTQLCLILLSVRTMTRSSSLGLWVYGALIFIGSNSLCVTHWKLDKDNNKVVPIETKHLAAGGSLVDDTRDDNTDIISTLKQRYGRDSTSVDTSQIPNVDKKCNVFPCDKLDDMPEEIRDVKEEHEGSDRTLSRSDSFEYSDTENVLEQPDEKKVPKRPSRPQPKGFE